MSQAVTLWASMPQAEFHGSFEAKLPAGITLASSLELERDVEQQAREHFGEMAADASYDVPELGDGARSDLCFLGMSVDWEYVEAHSDWFAPAADDDIPATLAYEVSVSLRHELTAEELALDPAGLHDRLLELAKALADRFAADTAAACGFRPASGEVDDYGYDEERP